MPSYLLKVRYSAEGLETVLRQGGTVRRAEMEKLAGALGGSVEAVYFAFGDDDLHVICQFPDNRAAATMSMIGSTSGAQSAVVVPLLTVEDLDAIAEGSRPAP